MLRGFCLSAARRSLPHFAIVALLILSGRTAAADEAAAAVEQLKTASDRVTRISAVVALSKAESINADAVAALLIAAREEFVSIVTPTDLPTAPKFNAGALKGDEVQPSRLKASPRTYLGKEFIVCGSVDLSSYYNWGYGEADGTHYSLKLTPIDANGKLALFEPMHLYLSRDVGGGFVETLAKLKESGGQHAIVRLRVTLDPERFTDQLAWNMLEVKDWQFYKQSDFGLWAYDGARVCFLVIGKAGKEAILPLLETITAPAQEPAVVDKAMRYQSLKTLTALDKPHLTTARARLSRIKPKDATAKQWATLARAAIQSELSPAAQQRRKK